MVVGKSPYSANFLVLRSTGKEKNQHEIFSNFIATWVKVEKNITMLNVILC